MDAETVSSVCPLLLPANTSRTCYHGFIQSNNGSLYEISVHIPDDYSMNGARLDVDWRLKYLLRDSVEIVDRRMCESNSLPEFLVELCNIVNCLEPNTAHPAPVSCHHLVSDLDAIGWQNIVELEPQFTALKIRCSDAKDRVHLLDVRLSPAEYPNKVPVVKADTPHVFQPKWPPRHGLVELAKQFRVWLEKFQALWDILDEVDNSTCVLEPERPSRSCVYRRLLVGQNISVALSLDVDRPSDYPKQCTFLGPDDKVEPYKRRLRECKSHWNTFLTLLSNLKSLLGLEFPTEKSVITEETSNDCVICYAYRLEGSAPDVVCNSCNKPFHYSCLYEWFMNVSVDHKKTKEMILGECPYCCKRITIQARRINSATN